MNKFSFHLYSWKLRFRFKESKMSNNWDERLTLEQNSYSCTNKMKDKKVYHLPDFEKCPAPSSHLNSRTLSSVFISLNLATNLAGSEYITLGSVMKKSSDVTSKDQESLFDSLNNQSSTSSLYKWLRKYEQHTEHNKSSKPWQTINCIGWIQLDWH